METYQKPVGFFYAFCITIQANPGVSESWYSIMVRCLRSYWKFLGMGSTWFQSLPGLFIKLFIKQDKGEIRLHCWTFIPTMQYPYRMLWMKEHCTKFENKSGERGLDACTAQLDNRQWQTTQMLGNRLHLKHSNPETPVISKVPWAGTFGCNQTTHRQRLQVQGTKARKYICRRVRRNEQTIYKYCNIVSIVSSYIKESRN